MTIKDIAREAGCAVSTVSRALNDHPDVSEETKRRIRQIVARSGFVPNSNARQLKVQQSKSIAVIVKGVANTFLADVLAQLQQHIARTDYAVAVQYIGEKDSELDAMERVRRELKPCGIVFLGGSARALAQRLAAAPMPCMLATTVAPDIQAPGLSMVGVDDRAAGRLAAQYLLAQGHRQLGVIGGDNAPSTVSALRAQGFAEACAEAGVVWEEALYEGEEFSAQGGYRAAQRLLERRPEVTALFCLSDLQAMGAIRAAEDRGRAVPRQLSVLGFDGLELGRYYVPRLATMRQPRADIARLSAELLLGQIERREKAQTMILEAALEPGESVARREE